MVGRPKVIVFDLDYTLWPFHVDTHVTPPFKKKGPNVVDSYGQVVKYFKDVPELLKQLKEEGYELGVASRTSEIRGAEELLSLFDWNKYFSYKEIYPGRKTAHFAKIKEQSGVEYNDMMFFDDEHRNIVDVGKIGVTCIYVKDGVTRTLLEKSLQSFANQ